MFAVRMTAKRLFDLLVALPTLLVTLPLQLILALGVLLESGRPIFFLQQRPGLHGRPFTLIKFRTMRVAVTAEDLHSTDRITPFGRWLRKTSLDELPSLVNVIKGDMSIVGPRPLLMEYLPLFSAEQARRHLVRPGLTGLAQISGRNELSWEEKFVYDVQYVDAQTLWLDFKIILRTLPILLGRRGINQHSSTTMEPFRRNDG